MTPAGRPQPTGGSRARRADGSKPREQSPAKRGKKSRDKADINEGAGADMALPDPEKLPLTFLKGAGPKRARALYTSGIESVEDLLHFFPFRYIDASQIIPIHDWASYLYKFVTIHGKVESVQVFRHSRPFRAVVKIRDQSRYMLSLVYFGYVDHLPKQFTVGKEYAVSGYVTTFQNMPQIVQPVHVEEVDTATLKQGKIIPVYRQTAELREVGLIQTTLRTIIGHALENGALSAEALKESLPGAVLNRHGLMPRGEAIAQVHEPTTSAELAEARRRLKYEELFFLQLRLQLDSRRRMGNAAEGIAMDVAPLTDALESKDLLTNPEKSSRPSHEMAWLLHDFLRSLTFELTLDQKNALREIAADLSKANGTLPMHRLLQGDVGSGKTIVATLAALTAVMNGYQVAFMAPTEILAEQHALTLSRQLARFPISVGYLRGGMKKRQRDRALFEVEIGHSNILVGTHALLEEDVRFDRLGLVIIDEQHRFGVAQRKALIEKALAPRTNSEGRVPHSPDVLIMTATPIPRTLYLTLYGDLDLTVIRMMPGGRKPIVTKLLYPADRELIHRAILRAVQERSEQIYIVYPLVEESEKSDLAAATIACEELRQILPELSIGLLHGKMSSDEKQRVMADFRDGKIDVLVTTTVVEVGVDVANATVMIIEHADRFGLSQLHQLRGRVGRGTKASFCILVASEKLQPLPGQEQASDRRISHEIFASGEQIEERSKARERLDTMVRTNDGFEIAEVDMRLRGPGEFFGTKQSGIPVLTIADLREDMDLLEMTKEDVERILDSDLQLRAPDNLPARFAYLRRYRHLENFAEIG